MSLREVNDIPMLQGRELAFEVLRLRYWQHLVNEALKRKAFNIPIHLGFGHEAIAAAVDETMGADDQLVLTHRNITYNLARAGSLTPIWNEYLLKPHGLAGGKLGSMNLTNPARGVMYSSSILGNNLSVGCGLALGQQLFGRSGVVIVLTGDGAMEEGQFYESLVFATSHKLKVIFIVENNNQAMSSTIEQRRCPISLAAMCSAIDISFREFAGNDVFDYVAELRSIRNRVLTESVPACLEVRLAAINQHAGPTPGWPTDPKNISLQNGLIVERTTDDPVFVLEQKLGSQVLHQLSDEILAEPWDMPNG